VICRLIQLLDVQDPPKSPKGPLKPVSIGNSRQISQPIITPSPLHNVDLQTRCPSSCGLQFPFSDLDLQPLDPSTNLDIEHRQPMPIFRCSATRIGVYMRSLCWTSGLFILSRSRAIPAKQPQLPSIRLVRGKALCCLLMFLLHLSTC
jgi:hypothetical protein